MWRFLEARVTRVYEGRGPKVRAVESARKGWRCAVLEINSRSPTANLTKLNPILTKNGTKTFNILHRELRYFIRSPEALKAKLDSFLRVVSDKSYLPFYECIKCT